MIGSFSAMITCQAYKGFTLGLINASVSTSRSILQRMLPLVQFHFIEPSFQMNNERHMPNTCTKTLENEMSVMNRKQSL